MRSTRQAIGRSVRAVRARPRRSAPRAPNRHRRHPSAGRAGPCPTREPPPWWPTTVCSMPCSSSSYSVWANAARRHRHVPAARPHALAPAARRSSTWGELVRSIQTRTRRCYAAAEAARARPSTTSRCCSSASVGNIGSASALTGGLLGLRQRSPRPVAEVGEHRLQVHAARRSRRLSQHRHPSACAQLVAARRAHHVQVVDVACARGFGRQRRPARPAPARA